MQAQSWGTNRHQPQPLNARRGEQCWQFPCGVAFSTRRCKKRRLRQAQVLAQMPEYNIPEEEVTGSEAWRARRRASTLPSLARTPEQTFVLAGLLKILLLASTFPAAYILKPLGRTPLGFSAYLLLIPFGIGLSYLAGILNRVNFMKRRWSGTIIVLGAALLMTGLGYLYDVKTEPVRTPAVTQPVEKHWSEELFNSRRPRSAADSDRIWKELEKEGAL